MTDLDLLRLADKISCTGVTEGLNVSLISKSCRYFHYCCDGFDDRVSKIFIYHVSMVITIFTCLNVLRG